MTKVPRKLPEGTPDVEAGRSGHDFNSGQMFGFITEEVGQRYDIILFVFVHLYAVCIHLSLYSFIYL